jgi:Cu+-exporting ATPase
LISLRLAASVERGSEHPLAFAILNAAKEQGFELRDVQNFASPAGKGASGTVDGRAAGVIAVADPIKPSAQEALRQLRDNGLRIVMLTGDNVTTAQAVAVEADVLPDRKSDVVTRRPMSASPWAAARTWQSRAQASRCCAAI